eukprot:XP_008180637.1 PREDICTED: uncharacterized protein LOC103308656 [Acyrthosiphon pisum]
MPQCFKCFSKFINYDLLFLHLKIYHQHITPYKCLESNFFRTFNCIKSFKKHVKGHDNNLNEQTILNLKNLQTPAIEHAIIGHETDRLNININNSQPTNNNITTNYESFVYNKALVLLSKWYNKSGVPRNKIQTIIDDFTSFLNDFLPQLHNNVIVKLQSNDKSTFEIDAMFNIIANPFKNFNTEHQRFKALEELGVFSRPKPVHLGYRLNDKLKNGRTIAVSTPINAYSAPLPILLRKFFEMPNVLNMMITYTEELLKNECIISNLIQNKKQVGNQNLFKHLISEINFLEESGINVFVNNQQYQIYFSLALIVGDNLGLHSILGFTECFVSNYPCRFCHSSKEECHAQISQNNENLRNIDNYNDDVNTKNVALTGIVESCIWNNVNSFHVVYNYSVDLMHDLLEGVCNYDMSSIIRNFILEFKYFSLEALNNRIQFFDYGPSEIKNRPPLINEHSLKSNNPTICKMSASEMWCFVRCFGLMIGDLVPIESEFWKLYILLKKILDLTTTRSIGLESSNTYLKC